MSKVIKVIAGEGFTSTIFEASNSKCFMVADMDIDVDGSGNSHGDPYFQSDTTLHFEGKPLNSDIDQFMVLPPSAIQGVTGIVLGCAGKVTNLANGKSCLVVVGDVGPTRKTGEASRAAAILLGINPDPNNGGVDTPEILYEWQPGQAAKIGDRQYQLKSS